MARLAITAPESTAAKFMYMPGGVHEISCTLNQTSSVTGKVLVNPKTAETLNLQLAEMAAKSAHRPYFDFNHEDGEASFWPQSFAWSDSPKPGVYAIGEWSAKGKDAIDGKAYRSFSGVFNVDMAALQKRKTCEVVCRADARLNMGGLVNQPAFEKNATFFAKSAERPEPENNQNDPTMKETLAELQAKLTTLTSEVKILTTKAATDATLAAELATKQSQLALAQSGVREAELQAKLDAQNERMAKKCVAAAVKRGVIPPQNAELQASWVKDIMTEPDRAALLDALEGAGPGLSEDITGGQPRSRIGHGDAREGLSRCMKAFGELAAKNSKVMYSVGSLGQKKVLAMQMGTLFAKELQGCDYAAVLGELQAADATDANLGILTGTLVSQKTIELFRLGFKLLNYIWTDFSDIPAELNQVINTRIVVVPAVEAYDATLNDDGVPNGWSVITPAQTTNVNLKLDVLVGCPIRFGLDTLSSTSRNLFGEFAPAAAYAMAKYFSEKIYALLTPANYNGYAAVNGAFVPDAYASYPVGLGDFARSALTKVESIFDPNEVPEQGRFALLNSKYHAQLGNDPSITQFYAAVRRPEIIEETDLPKMAGFKPIKAPNLAKNNATANLFGFFGHKASIVVASRPPVNLNEVLPGAQNGSVTTIMDPEMPITWQLVQYVNQQNGFAEWRLQAMLAAGVGDKRGGLCGISQ